MATQSGGSITLWLDGLREGDLAAAQEIWNRYFSELVALAQSKLQSLSRESDGEDIALSALKSVMLGVQANRFPDLKDRTNLWPLLVAITVRKSIDERRRQLARKRFALSAPATEDMGAIVAQQPSPEFALEVAEQMERLVGKFGDPVLQAIAVRKLEGLTNQEIADELSLSVRTVIRKLNRIRQEWEEHEDAPS